MASSFLNQGIIHLLSIEFFLIFSFVEYLLLACAEGFDLYALFFGCIVHSHSTKTLIIYLKIKGSASVFKGYWSPKGGTL